MKIKIKGLLGALAAALFAPNVLANNELRLNMPPGISDMSQKVYDLHMLVFYICVVIAVGVFGVMLVSIIRHRKSSGRKPATFHENVKVEIVWTVIPFLILIGMAVPATITLLQLDNTDDSELSIVVTGSQWRWHYNYLDYDVQFQSILATPNDQIYGRLPKGENYLHEVDRPLVLPTNTKVRFLITSEDVIHSWWVPEFAIKRDANPGYINESWTNIKEPGIYRGFCAELCGQGHAFMPIVVIAKEPADFEAWVKSEEERLAAEAQQEQLLLSMEMSKSDLMELGRNIYLSHCSACHQPNGQGIPGVFPRLAGEGMAVGDKQAHINIVLNGSSGTAMQAFRSSLSMSELAAVITYERNAWGNDTGDLVQAADIFNFIQGEE